MVRPIITSLWFDGNAVEAAEFYCSVFPDSRVTTVTNYTAAGPGPEGTPMVVEFALGGQPFIGINGGPQFPFSEAVSLTVTCEDQAELDRYWAQLSEGGQEGPCGWCKDRFGLSWQVVPDGMDAMFAHPDPARAQRAMKAMLGMGKIDIAALYAAADGEPTA